MIQFMIICIFMPFKLLYTWPWDWLAGV